NFAATVSCETITPVKRVTVSRQCNRDRQTCIESLLELRERARNTSVSLSKCTCLDIRDSPFPGKQLINPVAAGTPGALRAATRYIRVEEQPWMVDCQLEGLNDHPPLQVLVPSSRSRAQKC